MKGRLIALEQYRGREAAALMVDGRLDDIRIDAPLPRPGSIYRAIADRPVKGQGGMFLTTPDGTAFLRQVKGLSPGQPILVQVTGYAEPGKAIPVTNRLLFKSRYAIVTPGAPGVNISRSIRDDDRRDAVQVAAREALAQTPLPEGAGLIIRSSAGMAEAEEIASDVADMAGLAAQVLADADGPAELLLEGDGPHDLAWREWTEPAQIDTAEGCFADHGIDALIAGLESPVIALGGGHSMIIEPTSALVAIDVNTGGDTSPAAGLKANLAAARDLPRQLRLRGLGGLVIVDPAPIPKKDRRQLESALRAAFKRDSTETILAGWTQLGLLEIQRKRDRLPLTRIFSQAME
ncbi:ribonuclease E/G [Cognatishimia sp. F0-27]|uniref:ribonuclease E/G n=1 Tax=Cognatishimia sp. F0-27 TaxID=2816855 RepID=UPI001D0CB01E|nr:ribonuclease E/G [Cognatishimia sp. F0-27]MCC1495008.1 ribonuclease E/G [Cognatishimia sp. F0-27]